ncbi:MAG TPA: HD domain-containing phosphohydrolase, partial [Pseudomonadales bacterium]|nr:HD domain-containing phosphohydrolase [Pseudomonadales bacterium]
SSAISAAMKDGLGCRAVSSAVVSFRDQLILAISEAGGAAVRLEMKLSLCVHGGRSLVNASIRGRTAIAFLRQLQLGGLEFSAAATPEAIHGLVSLAVADPSSGAAHAALGFSAGQATLTGIRPLPPLDDVRWDAVGHADTVSAYGAAGLELGLAEPLRMEIVTAVESAVDAAGDGHAVNLDVARTASETIVNEQDLDNLLQLAERPEFDVFTVQHSLRVAVLTSYVARQMGAPLETVIEMTAAAMYHDVGKGLIPDSILYKPGRLDEEERRIMSTHPERGAEILLESPDVGSYALGAAWGHHLRHDGHGYPDRRPWFVTNRATSLIQICDVYEALTARRPYKDAFSPAKAYQVLHSDPGAFDPGLLAAFTRAIGLYPPGRFVAMSDGRLGRVSRAGRGLDRPVVRTFPAGEIVELDGIDHAELHVTELMEEPDFVRRLRDEG